MKQTNIYKIIYTTILFAIGILFILPYFFPRYSLLQNTRYSRADALLRIDKHLSQHQPTQSDLFDAMRFRDPDVVELLIKHGVELNASGTYSWTPLTYAVQFDNLKMIPILIKHGADVNKPDNFGHTPLHTAAESDNPEAISLLTKHGADPNKPDNFGHTPLHIAAESDKPETISLLIKHDADVNKPDNFGHTPLHTAAESDKPGAISLLIKHGADINALDEKQRTPLHEAVAICNLEGTQLLITHGADVNIKDELGHTPLHSIDKYSALADKRDNLHAQLSAHTNTPNESPAQQNIPSMIEKIIQLLIKHGADANTNSLYIGTPLHCAASRGNYILAQALINNGADVNASSNIDRTPLFEAAEYGHPNIVHLLITHGAHINATDSGGYTPLHLAAKRGLADITDILIKNGAHIDAQARYTNETPLTLAQSNHHEQTIELIKGVRLQRKLFSTSSSDSIASAPSTEEGEPIIIQPQSLPIKKRKKQVASPKPLEQSKIRSLSERTPPPTSIHGNSIYHYEH